MPRENYPGPAGAVSAPLRHLLRRIHPQMDPFGLLQCLDHGKEVMAVAELLALKDQFRHGVSLLVVVVLS